MFHSPHLPLRQFTPVPTSYVTVVTVVRSSQLRNQLKRCYALTPTLHLEFIPFPLMSFLCPGSLLLIVMSSEDLLGCPGLSLSLFSKPGQI